MIIIISTYIPQETGIALNGKPKAALELLKVLEFSVQRYKAALEWAMDKEFSDILWVDPDTIDREILADLNPAAVLLLDPLETHEALIEALPDMLPEEVTIYRLDEENKETILTEE